MSKELYAYSIEPGDRDHLAAYYFVDGVVEAEPNEIAAIVEEVRANHFGLLTIRPIDQAKIDFAKLRLEVGSGLRTYHGEEVMGDEPCPGDATYIDAYERDAYGPPGNDSD
jgi:hypothetical protein